MCRTETSNSKSEGKGMKMKHEVICEDKEKSKYRCRVSWALL
jgi:hypothetical protein